MKHHPVTSPLDILVFIIGKLCEGVLAPSNGIKEGSDYSTGSSVRFSCHTGYSLVGEEIITCYEVQGEISGAWDYEVPICQGKVYLIASS